MSKTPAIDVETMHDLIADGADAKERASLQDNPLSALVEEYQEFGDIAVSPHFKSLKDEAGNANAPVSERRATPTAKQSADDSFNVATAQPKTEDLQKSLPAATAPTVKPKNHSAASSKSAYRITTEASSDPLAMPARQGSKAGAVAGGSLTSTPTRTPKKRKGIRGLAMAAVALITVAGAGYLYVQGTRTASSESVVYSVPVFDDSNTGATQIAQPIATTDDATDKPIQVAEITPPPAMLPTSATPQPLGFDDSLSNEFPTLEGQSLLDLATGIPTFSPSEIVPTSEWQETSCGGCHSFDQADLCKQGAYYFNHDKARLNRIQHPYGGGFKQKLMEWAEGGCN